MPVVVTAADRTSFTRCRRQWDFGAALRQNLERRQTTTLPDLDRAVRDALAVYYFPGMWDWERTVRLPLVGQELERALTRQRQRQQQGQRQQQRGQRQRQRGAADNGADDENWQEALDRGQALLDRYIAWAPNADRFAPVLVETDFEADVLDPVRPDAALVTSTAACTPGPANPNASSPSSRSPTRKSAAPGCAAVPPTSRRPAAGSAKTWPR
jgi:hypothetical protein